MFTAKEIRDRSPAWRRFVQNHDRYLLAGKRAIANHLKQQQQEKKRDRFSTNKR